MIVPQFVKRRERGRPMPNFRPSRRGLFWLVIIFLPVAFFLGLGALLWDRVAPPAMRALLDQIPAGQLLSRLPESERQEVLSQLASNLAGPWDIDPDPLIARLMKPNKELRVEGHAVQSNNAGLRSSRPYGAKQGAYRIVVLGDSVAVGQFVAEEERIGDRIERYLNEKGVTVSGRPIEVITLALSSWTTETQARYLTTRFSSYEPDLVLLLMVHNDILPTAGVNGSGHASVRFSAQERALGSGYTNPGNVNLFLSKANLKPAAGIAPTGEALWRRAALSLLRLETLLQESGGRLLISVLDANPAFTLKALESFERVGLQSPVLLTRYQMEPAYILDFDPHPSPEGHWALALHQLHALAALGWLPLRREDLPEHHPSLSLETDHRISPAAVRSTLDRIKVAPLHEAADFRPPFDEAAVMGLMGGFWPGDRREPFSALPFASPRAILLLRRKTGAQRVHAEIDVPARPELFPFDLTLKVNGLSAAHLRLGSVEEAGLHELSGAITPNPVNDGVVELVFQAATSYATINDGTMKSFRPRRVWQE